MRLKCKVIFLLALLSSSVVAWSQAIIPQPIKSETRPGVFLLDSLCVLKFDFENLELARIAGFFGDYLQELYGFRPKGKQAGRELIFELKSSPKLGAEGYKLSVNPERIILSANAPAGVFYAMQSLKQLLPVDYETQVLEIQSQEIVDKPRFSWRGNMLDVSRHYFPLSFLKKYIDLLASYKINTFHWHLTDDQGWRIEIKKYPLLTEIGHWRDETMVGHYRNGKGMDGIGYGGFYTQEQCRELVRYAAERYITIVPEIEMPGHSSAALASYPWLGCTGGPYEVKGTWGIHKDVYCAGKEETFRFLQDVLDEVMAIFPSRYIHVGGDECPKDAWEKCEACQQRMKEVGCTNEHELQSWFITRMDKYLSTKGRRLVGWDEILEGGLAPEATVMSWRGIKGGIVAAKQHHDVVMSPTSHMYLDYYQSQDKENEPLAIGGYLPVEKVYSYEPVPEELTADEAQHILGLQTNLWTEYIPNTRKVEYMLLPRLQAEAEVAWTPAEKKDLEDFLQRLLIDYKRLDRMGVNYRNHQK